MKKRALSFSLALLLALGLLPSAALAVEKDPASQHGGLTCEEIIPPQYEDAQVFSEDLAAVKKDGKWGYINKQNEVVIPFRYAYAWPFGESKAIVLVETKGMEDAPNIIEKGYSITYSEYQVLELGFIDLEGNYTPFQFGYAGEADEDGIEPHYESITYEYSTYTYTQYAFDATTQEYTDKVWRSETYDGPDTTRPEDMSPLYFYNGAAWIGDAIYGSDGKEIVIHTADDHSGSIVQGPVYEGSYPWVVGALNEGLIPFQLKGLPYYLAGYADATGTIVKLFSYEYFGDPVSVTGDDGEPQERRSFTRIYNVTPFNQGLALAIQGTYDAETGSDAGKYYGFIDRNYDWVIPPQFCQTVMTAGQRTYYEIFGKTGLAMVHNEEGYWGAIDKEGNTVLPFIYDTLWPVSDGMILFQRDGACGYLDAETLDVAIPAQYQQAGHFYDGMAAVYDGEEAFLIDRNGQRIPSEGILDPSLYSVEYDDGSVDVGTPNGYVVTEQDGKYGVSYVSYCPALPEASQMSGWAYPEVTAAIQEELVPASLQNLYHRDMTRDDFCLLVVDAVSKILGKEPEDLVLEKTGKPMSYFYGADPFPDAISNSSIIANALGIVNGRDTGLFDPYSPITRQEAAAMLTRAARVLGLDTTGPAPSAFVERNDMPQWALEAVDYVSQIGVMGGVGDGRFDPYGSYTREQSYMTIYRLFKAYQAQQ